MWKCGHCWFDDGMLQVQRYSRAYVSNDLGLDLSSLLLLLQVKDFLIASWLFCFCVFQLLRKGICTMCPSHLDM